MSGPAAAVAVRRESVAFAGSRAGTAELTWGQASIWLAMRRTGADDDAYFNFGRIVEAPRRSGPVPVAAALVAVARLVERHESLRTRLAAAEADPVQRLAATGTLTAEVVEAEPDRAGEAAQELHDRLLGRHFDYVEDWPLRVGLVTAAGSVTHVVLVFCHLAADGHGADVAARDLRLLLLRGRLPGPPPLQPLDLAREQRSPAGQRAGRAAPEFWEPVYQRLPATMFGRPSGAGEDPPFRRAQLVSAALDGASRLAGARAGVSPTTVLMAAASALVGTLTGHRTCAMYPVVSNRFRARTLELVSPLAQDGMFVLDLDEPTFDALARAAWQAAVRAYRRAEFDPAAWLAMVARVRAARGEPVRPLCCINDQRPQELAAGAAGRLGPPLPDLAAVQAARARTTLSWPLRLDNLNCRFCLHVTGEAGGLGVALTADTRYLAARDIERFLWALEAVVVRAAAGDLPAADIPALLAAAGPLPAGAAAPARL